MRLLAVLALGTLVLAPLSETASAQEAAPQQRVVKKRNFAVLCQKESFAKGNPKTCARFVKKEAEPKQPEQPSRPDFTADDQALAVIPGIPDARVWGDSAADFVRLLPAGSGPWLAISGGGSDGAFGAGVLTGWTESGTRPEFTVVTGVSIGALIAPFAFLGPRYDEEVHKNFTTIGAADIFEDRVTRDSLFDYWPLRRAIAPI